MKKIKLFSMLAVALIMCSSLHAQDYYFSSYASPANTDVKKLVTADNPSDYIALTHDASLGTSARSLNTAVTSIIDNTVSITSINSYIKITDAAITFDVSTTFSIKVLFYSNSTNSAASLSLATNGETKVSVSANAKTTFTLEAADLSAGAYTLTAVKEMDIAEILVTYAPRTDPWFSISPAEVNLYQNPFMEEATETVTIKGENLADGTYDLTIPTVEGLSVEPASVTVTDGALNETITLTYKSTENREEGTAEVALTIGDLTEKLAITYSAQVTLLEQTSVSEATTWDWSKAGATAIQLTADTKPSKNDTIVLANADDIANDETFNSQALLVCGEYLVRDGSYFQGGYILFKTGKAGKVTVDFSNTGSKNPTRYLCINGTRTTYSTVSSSTTRAVSGAIDVPAGDVTIGFASDDEGDGQYARVYVITYTPNDDTTTSVEAAVTEAAPATKVVRDGQLLIIRDGKTYNAQGAFVR